MASSKKTRILWSAFSNTVPEFIQDRRAFNDTCAEKGVEVILWSQGQPRKGTLHYFFPLRSKQKLPSEFNSWVSRYLARYPHLSNPDEVVAYVVDNFKLMLESFRPDVFVSWNRFDPTFGLPYQLALREGIACFDLERALIPNFLSLGLDFREDPVELDHRLVERGREILRAYPSGHIYPKALQKRGTKKLAKRVLLVLGSWDAVSDVRTSIYSTSAEMANCLARDLREWLVVLKPHPLAQKCSTEESNFQILESDPVELINMAQVIVTSGTKLELNVVLAGKPLVLAGGGFLYGSGAAGRAHSHEEVLELVKNVRSWHDRQAAYDRLAGYVAQKASNEWFMIEKEAPYSRNLSDLLDRLTANPSATGVSEDLQDCILDYYAAFINRYHRSGVRDFGGLELLSELKSRVRRKLGFN